MEAWEELAELRKTGDELERGIEVLSAIVGYELPSSVQDWTKEQLQQVEDVHVVIFVYRELPGFQQAWSRRLESFPFPIRVEGTRFFCRAWKGDWDWEENEEYSAALQNYATRAARTDE